MHNKKINGDTAFRADENKQQIQVIKIKRKRKFNQFSDDNKDKNFVQEKVQEDAQFVEKERKWEKGSELAGNVHNHTLAKQLKRELYIVGGDKKFKTSKLRDAERERSELPKEKKSVLEKYKYNWGAGRTHKFVWSASYSGLDNGLVELAKGHNSMWKGVHGDKTTKELPDNTKLVIRAATGSGESLNPYLHLFQSEEIDNTKTGINRSLIRSNIPRIKSKYGDINSKIKKLTSTAVDEVKTGDIAKEDLWGERITALSNIQYYIDEDKRTLEGLDALTSINIIRGGGSNVPISDVESKYNDGVVATWVKQVISIFNNANATIRELYREHSKTIQLARDAVASKQMRDIKSLFAIHKSIKALNLALTEMTTYKLTLTRVSSTLKMDSMDIRNKLMSREATYSLIKGVGNSVSTVVGNTVRGSERKVGKGGGNGDEIIQRDYHIPVDGIIQGIENIHSLGMKQSLNEISDVIEVGNSTVISAEEHINKWVEILSSAQQQIEGKAEFFLPNVIVDEGKDTETQEKDFNEIVQKRKKDAADGNYNYRYEGEMYRNILKNGDKTDVRIIKNR